MPKSVLSELVELLALEKIEENLFRGQSQDLGWGTVFGGQVLGQSLSAAVQTVPPERHVHSLHAYFLRPGDVSKPIVYDVDRIRDGSSFTTRRVVAIQSGRPIFSATASFQIEEAGLEHQNDMPDVPAPEQCPTEQERALAYADKVPAPMRKRLLGAQAFELRPVGPPEDAFHPAPQRPVRSTWLRAIEKLPDDPALHRYLLAYVSDNGLITTALMPHGITWLTPGMQIASLDHTMYFHQPFRVDEWLLYVRSSPQARGARGVAQGSIFTQDGRLVATTVQEGLLRPRPPKT
ncbi:MAG: Acyl-CoA thioesterase [Labilithrix sp.]|nr:Acyl-CoA thioesterase [Labilithrix sp.]